jgi:hypothetical protein
VPNAAIIVSSPAVLLTTLRFEPIPVATTPLTWIAVAP